MTANRGPEWQLPAGAHTYYSTRNAGSGAPPDPVVTFGPAETFGKILAENTTFHVVAVQDIGDLRAVLGSVPCIGLVAMSLDGEPGGAGEAIEAFRASPSGHEFALYAAKSLDVEAAAQRAAEYGADAVIMRGVLVNEFLDTILTVLRRTKTSVPRPKSPDEHVRLLRELCPRSPFWEVQRHVDDETYVDPQKEY